MKKLLLSGSIAAILLPALAFAAYNSVTLTTNVDLSVNSITLDVASTDSVIESIVVDSGQFSATLQAGSSLKVSPATNNKLIYDIIYAGNIASSVDYVCTSATSTLQVTAVASSTITITPQSALCADATSTTSTGSSRSDERGGGGGGGGGTVVVATPVATETAQINTLMAQIDSLRAQIAALMGGGVTTPATVTAGRVTLTTNLSKGSRGASVKSLQQFLNTHGFVIATSGPGSSGNETDMLGNLTVQAIQKFQKQYGIADVGTPGYGTVGPKTRAKINELSAQ